MQEGRPRPRRDKRESKEIRKNFRGLRVPHNIPLFLKSEGISHTKCGYFHQGELEKRAG